MTDKGVQPILIAAAGALAAVAGARIALLVLAVILVSGVLLLPWRVGRKV